MERDSFIFYRSWWECISDESEEVQFDVLRAIIGYVFSGDARVLSPKSEMALKFILQDIDRDSEKYERVKKARSEAGRRHSGNQYSNKNGTNGTNGTSVPTMEQNGTNGTNGTVDVDVDVNVDDNVNNISANADLSETSSDLHVDYIKMAEYWNEKTGGMFGKLSGRFSDTRKRHIAARIREHGKEKFIEAIKHAGELTHLADTSWFNFDWLIKPTNYEKFISGNYDKPFHKNVTQRANYDNVEYKKF